MKKCVICGKEHYARDMLRRKKSYICAPVEKDPKTGKWVPDCIDKYEWTHGDDILL